MFRNSNVFLHDKTSGGCVYDGASNRYKSVEGGIRGKRVSSAALSADADGHSLSRRDIDIARASIATQLISSPRYRRCVK